MRRVILAAFITVGCVDINQDLNQQSPTPVITQTTSPSGSPSPTPAGPPPPVATVAVGEYAREGGEGPCLTGTKIRVGCAAFITCTPRDSSGLDIGPRYVPDWSQAGAIVVTPTTINVYNAKVRCDYGGVGIAACAVGGVLGSIQYDCVPP